MKSEKNASFMKIVRRSKKRVGRGHGSGKVKTSGRGQKGQNARGGVKMGFEGGQLPLIKRLPLLRGKGKNGTFQEKVTPVSLAQLNKLPADTSVTLETLKKYHMIDSVVSKAKVLGDGKLTVKLTVLVPCSGSAKVAIEKAGGVVDTSGSHE